MNPRNYSREPFDLGTPPSDDRIMLRMVAVAFGVLLLLGVCR